MSITSAMFTGVSGLLNNGEAMNVIGNNISNVNTVGFKGARMLFSDMLSQNIGNNSQIGRGMQIQKVENLFGQGSFETTENVTDLGIQGNSFFALKPPTTAAPVAAQNAAFLSRAGAFHVDKDLYLVNPDGYQVLDTAGQPIRFYTGGTADQNFSKVVKVEPNGLITYLAQDGITNLYYSTTGAVGLPTTTVNAAAVQRLAVVSATDLTGLEKVGGSLYKATAPSGVSAAGFTLAGNQPNGTSEKVLSNSLEQSNVDLASQFVKMIITQRAYSANSKTITTADEMTQEVLNLKR
ncbi:flagellar hook-basal body protein [Geotalea toluenoxydans]|uniref:flagellar hook-basal body protein n=1 Tax=Geotalea toluenoxydans TaxID=421624 RepID=UPI0006D0A633|nr:flagellar hook basal-body protein [Geotalea toluenoxydans]